MPNLRKKGLFKEYSLDDHLRRVSSSMEAEIKNMPFEKISEESEEKIIDTLLSKYNVVVPSLLEDKMEINANEEEITIIGHNSRSDLIDGPIRAKGLSIYVTIPFEGVSELFKCSPSLFSSAGTPSADVKKDRLILHYETIEKDSDEIKGLWKSDIASIKENLGWIEKNLKTYSATLESNIQKLLADRKKEAEDNASLISKLKE